MDRATSPTLLAALLLAAAVAVTYGPTVNAPLVYDDTPNILWNESIRSVIPPWDALVADRDAATAGRPFVNFTFALTYAVSGPEPWAHRLFNIVLHIMSALTLFGLVRRACSTSALASRHASSGFGLGLATALLWALHPINADAVTYISQRLESQMGLCYLLTAYCALRSWQAEAGRRWWTAAAVAACFVGAGSKEVIIAAPVTVLLMDCVLLRKTPSMALRTSPWLYGGLLLCMAALTALAFSGATAGTGAFHESRGVVEYWLTQGEVFLYYLQCIVWPPSIVFDAIWRQPTLMQAAPGLLAAAAIVLATGYGVVRRRSWSVPAAWFLLALAPTSLLPMAFAVFPYRLYVPLAGVAALAVFGFWSLMQRLARRSPSVQPAKTAQLLCLVICVALGASVFARNELYKDPVLFWLDVTEKAPTNYRAFNWAGLALLDRQRPVDAAPYFRKALALKPDHTNARAGLGRALIMAGEYEEGVPLLRQVLTTPPQPWFGRMRMDLAFALLEQGRHTEAREVLDHASLNQEHPQIKALMERARTGEDDDAASEESAP